MKKNSMLAIIIIIIIILIGVLIYIPFSGILEYKLSNYQGKVPTESGLKNVLSHGLIKDYFKEVTVEKTDTTYQISVTLKSNTDSKIYENLEHQVAIITKVFKGVDLVTYTLAKRVYPFSKTWLNNAMIVDVTNMTLEQIETHYKNLPKTKLYLGNINGLYNIYDTNVVCDETYVKFYEDTFSTYSINCADVNNIELVNTTNISYKLLTAIERKLIMPDSLLDKGLDVIRTSKDSAK